MVLKDFCLSVLNSKMLIKMTHNSMQYVFSPNMDPSNTCLSGHDALQLVSGSSSQPTAFQEDIDQVFFFLFLMLDGYGVSNTSGCHFL